MVYKLPIKCNLIRNIALESRVQYVDGKRILNMILEIDIIGRGSVGR
jgi:hypothetical protein